MFHFGVILFKLLKIKLYGQIYYFAQVRGVVFSLKYCCGWGTGTALWLLCPQGHLSLNTDVMRQGAPFPHLWHHMADEGVRDQFCSHTLRAGSVHPCYQGQHYCVAWTKCRACSFKCFSMWEAGPALPLTRS